MSEVRLKCPWCGKRLQIESGGWAYQRSQIVLHLTGCYRRPADSTPAEINITADYALEDASDGS